MVILSTTIALNLLHREWLIDFHLNMYQIFIFLKSWATYVNYMKIDRNLTEGLGRYCQWLYLALSRFRS